MRFDFVKDKTLWDDFVQQFPRASFLQSWAWGEFQQSQGSIPFYVGIFEEDRLIGAALVIGIPSRRGTYMECIGGPLCTKDYMLEDAEPFRQWLGFVRDLAKKQRAGFMRLRLPFEDTLEGRQFLKQFGFRETLLWYQAEATRMLDLSASSDMLLKNMEKQTRYDIRRAEREGVVIEKADSKKFDVFLDLYHLMVQRQKYIGYTDAYMRQQFEVFAKDNHASLYLAKYHGQYVAGAVILRFGNMSTYLHAASIPLSKFSPTANMVWRAIHDAKEQGSAYFDLFGIAPPGKRYASRIGLTKFKQGLGGNEFYWLRTHDFVLSPFAYARSSLAERMPTHIRTIGSHVVSSIKR